MRLGCDYSPRRHFSMDVVPGNFCAWMKEVNIFLNVDNQTLASLSYIHKLLKSFSSSIKSWQCLGEKAFFAQGGTHITFTVLTWYDMYAVVSGPDTWNCCVNRQTCTLFSFTMLL